MRGLQANILKDIMKPLRGLQTTIEITVESFEGTAGNFFNIVVSF